MPVPEYRKLSEEERKIILKQIEELRQERDYEHYAIAFADLAINQGLYQNFLRQKREYQQKRRTSAENLNRIEQTVIILQNQLELGVEQKTNAEAGGKKDGG